MIGILDSRVLTDSPVYFTGYSLLFFIHHRNFVYAKHIHKPPLNHKLRLQKLLDINFINDRGIQHRFSDFFVVQFYDHCLRIGTEHLNFQIFKFFDPFWQFQNFHLKSNVSNHTDILSGSLHIRTSLPADCRRQFLSVLITDNCFYRFSIGRKHPSLHQETLFLFQIVPGDIHTVIQFTHTLFLYSKKL